jgi:hypothetical protein
MEDLMKAAIARANCFPIKLVQQQLVAISPVLTHLPLEIEWRDLGLNSPPLGLEARFLDVSTSVKCQDRPRLLSELQRVAFSEGKSQIALYRCWRHDGLGEVIVVLLSLVS